MRGMLLLLIVATALAANFKTEICGDKAAIASWCKKRENSCELGACGDDYMCKYRYEITCDVSLDNKGEWDKEAKMDGRSVPGSVCKEKRFSQWCNHASNRAKMQAEDNYECSHRADTTCQVEEDNRKELLTAWAKESRAEGDALVPKSICQNGKFKLWCQFAENRKKMGGTEEIDDYDCNHRAQTTCQVQ